MKSTTTFDDQFIAHSDEGTKAAVENYPLAWLITYQRPGAHKGMLDVVYHGHNAISDYRMIDPDAKSQPLYAAPVAAQAQPKSDGISIKEIADYIADNWPMKKYSLEQICDGLLSTKFTAQQPVSGADGWDLAEKVRKDLDRQSCPDVYMRIAVESIVSHAQPQPSGNAAKDAECLDWLDKSANCADWADGEPTKRVIRADDGVEFQGETWRAAIAAAIAQQGKGVS